MYFQNGKNQEFLGNLFIKWYQVREYSERRVLTTKHFPEQNMAYLC